MKQQRIKICDSCGEEFEEGKVYGWTCPLIDCDGQLFIDYKKNKP